MSKRIYFVTVIITLFFLFSGLTVFCAEESSNDLISESGTMDGTMEMKEDADCPSEKYIELDPSLWYHESVDYVLKKGYFRGVQDDQFEPDGVMTRAMFVTVLSRMEGIEKDAYTGSIFEDVPDGQWYSSAVEWASENNIVKGVGENHFDPDGKISREQMAAIMYRYADRGVDVSIDEGSECDEFSDFSQISDWAGDAMNWAVDVELLKGTDIGLEPQSSATRSQVAAVLMRFSELVLNNMQVYSGDLGGVVCYSLNGQTERMKVYWTGKGSGITKGYYYSVGLSDGFISEQTPSFDGLTDQIREIEIEEGVKGLECFLFTRCDQVEKLSIPASLTDIKIIPESPYGYGVIPETTMSYESFISENKLKTITVSEGNPSYCSVDGVLFNKDRTALVQYPGGSERETYVVPDGVTRIDTAAINHASHLKHLIIPESVTHFERLSSCPQLEDLQLPSHLESVRLTIQQCDSLEELTLPEGVSYLTVTEAGIRSLTLPSSLADFNPFYINASKLENLFVSGQNSTFSSVDGVLFSKDGKKLVCFPKGRTGEYDIPEGVSEIGKYAFWESSLTSCIFSDSIRIIGEHAFDSSCLTSCVIPEGVEILGEYAFEECTKLESLTVPASVTSPLTGNHVLCDCGPVFRYLYLGGTEEHWKNRLFGYFPENTEIHYLG